MKTRLTALLLALSMMLGLVSCGGQPVGEETSPATSQTPVESNGVEADNHYPVTVETYDQNGEIVEQTFEACPERVVSISQANTELLIALGLTDKIVATAHRFSPVYERMADEYNSIPLYCGVRLSLKRGCAGSEARFDCRLGVSLCRGCAWCS